jgi:hypothetical protein
MGVSGQRHAPAALLPPGKGPPVPIVQKAGWAPEPVWTQRLKEKSFAPAGKTLGRTTFDQWPARRKGVCLHSTTQQRNTKTNVHALSGIRTHDPSNEAAIGTGFVWDSCIYKCVGHCPVWRDVPQGRLKSKFEDSRVDITKAVSYDPLFEFRLSVSDVARCSMSLEQRWCYA